MQLHKETGVVVQMLFLGVFVCACTGQSVQRDAKGSGGSGDPPSAGAGGGADAMADEYIPGHSHAGDSGRATGPGGNGAKFDPDAPLPEGLTYHKDVAPLIATNCRTCHTNNGIAPFTLTTFRDVKRYAAGIVDAVVAREMPPWGARETAECKPRLPFLGDLRMAQKDIDTIRSWYESGAVEGDPLTASPLSVPPVLSMSRVDVELTPKVPFVANGTKDQFICFVMPSGIATDGWADGIHIVPGNPKVVHHSAVWTAPATALPKLQGRMASIANGYYECPTGADVGEGGTLLLVWTPGQSPNELRAGVAMPIAKNSLVVHRIHYSAGGATALPDATKVQLKMTTTVPKYQLLPVWPVSGGTNFVIPPNVRGQVETASATVPQWLSGYIYASNLHMHLVGRDIKFDILRSSAYEGQPQKECLAQDPHWEFHWQRNYAYDAPIESLPKVRPGDRFTVRCTYDNDPTINHDLAAALEERGYTGPISVKQGDATMDEMCLVNLSIAVPVVR
jgi:Copper type II ascorbate-dependent monooxygenase, C-terminal domain